MHFYDEGSGDEATDPDVLPTDPERGAEVSPDV
jgi:hypothetical protein